MTHRVAVLHRDNCLSKKCNLECINFCPVNRDESECIVLGVDGKAIISEPLCTGCGICVKKCPFDAITIVNLAEELSEQKVHQYGNNTFRLYRLPTPRNGSVVGLLGRNGVGKTTALNILSGNLKPNLGNYEEEPNWDDVLEFFKGTELKLHFEKVVNQDLIVSIKPQAVYKIRDAWKDDGLSLLKKLDERSAASELVDELNLKESINRQISEMSGGELQRLAIAVAASRVADLYMFDEPASYNDVFQRLAVSRVIQSLADDGKSVILVEHDISFLDYVSDSLHILHGESGAYGIVSSGLPSRTGINVLLDGYLPGENIRFRDSKISFNVFAPPDTETPFPRVSGYQDLVKSFKNFTLKVSAGEIKAGSVIGAIGGNALGKSTFMRILAGLEQPDKGKVELISTVSYKPQYLTANFDGDVQSLFYESFGERVEDPLFQSEVIHPLRINMLYDKKVKNLSGGELQKVAVATTLMRDADIYALDEPSAFIDVEERFVLARAIQRFVRSRGRSAIVIDHDIQLIDLVSDSLITFTGKPAEEGFASRPVSKSTGMNLFLRDLGITYRRDVESGRPRVNKRESRLDKAQKDSGMYYYVATGAEQEQLRPAQ